MWSVFVSAGVALTLCAWTCIFVFVHGAGKLGNELLAMGLGDRCRVSM